MKPKEPRKRPGRRSTSPPRQQREGPAREASDRQESTPPEDKIERAVISFPLADRPVTSRGDISPEDDARTEQLAHDLQEAMTRPLTEQESAAADVLVAQWDRADELLDGLIAAAKSGSIDLVAVEGDGPMRFYIEAPMRGRKWQRVAELLLGDDDPSSDAIGAN